MSAVKEQQYFPGAKATAEGIEYAGALFLPVIDKCEGCGRAHEFEGKFYCQTYSVPSAKWAIGVCNFSTHARTITTSNTKVNPLKASKRAAKGKKG